MIECNGRDYYALDERGEGVMGVLLDSNEVRLNHEQARRIVAKAVREATTPSPYGQGSDVEVRRLWAEGIDDDSFDNSHACWNFFEAVN